MIQVQETAAAPNKVTYFVKSLYYDPFRWSLLKSLALFAVGIKFAREFKGFELMPPQTIPTGP